MSREPGKLIGAKSSFKLITLRFVDHYGYSRVRRYADERCLLECVFERHSGLTPGVMVWSAISYHRRSKFR
ncbi:hypothetical protein TNCV_2960031 [Trichonephila clavipes]|nr:hypothetical protein TNCV_2960031 [Trichonephila clavipes]